LGGRMASLFLVKMNLCMLTLLLLILKLLKEQSTRSRKLSSKEWRFLRDPMSYVRCS